MATKFSDIAKGPKNLLSDDYTSKISLKAKKNAGAVAVTVETDRGSGGALASKIGTKFTYAGLCVDKAQLTADGGQVLETSLVPTPGVKLTFKGNKGADAGVEYTKGTFYGTSVLDVKDLSRVGLSACYGLSSGLKFGADTTYALSGKKGFSAYNLGASFSKGPIFGSVTTSSKLSQANLGLLYTVNKDISIASQTTHSKSKYVELVAVGGLYKSPYGNLKAKVGSDGIVSAAVIKEVVPAVTLTASGSVAVSDVSNFTYGLGIAI